MLSPTLIPIKLHITFSETGHIFFPEPGLVFLKSGLIFLNPGRLALDMTVTRHAETFGFIEGKRERAHAQERERERVRQ